MSNLKDDQGLHLIKTLPRTIADLSVSRSFFQTVAINFSFLDIAVDEWNESL